MRVVFVCTGNTCRSPLAAALLSLEEPGVEVLSAGVAAMDGAPAALEARELASELGADLSSHRSRLLAPDIVAYGLILTLTRAHRDLVRRSFPEAASRTFSLGEYAGEPDHDVLDPLGLGMGAYRGAAKEIQMLLALARRRLGRLFLGLVGVAGDPDAAQALAAIGERLVRQAVPHVRLPGAADDLVQAVRAGVSSGDLIACIVLPADAAQTCADLERHKGLRAMCAEGEPAAAAERPFDGSQVLCLDARNQSPDSVWEIVKMFLHTGFEQV